MIGLIAVTAAGRAAADRLSAAWPEGLGASGDDPGPRLRRYDGPVADAVRRAWRECEALVCFVATGVAVRLIAPLLADKHTDPAVICVDEAGRWAIALTGGHAAGGNELATRVAAALEATPVITTASDVTGIPGLDTLGWPVEGAVAAVGRALLDGEPVRLVTDRRWPLPALPGLVSELDDVGRVAPPGGTAPTTRLVISDRILEPDDLGPRTAVLRPPALTIGIGASRGVSAAELDTLVDAALADAGLTAGAVRALATADIKRDEPAILACARQRGWPLLTFAADRLATVDVPNPSAVVRAAVGTPSVAEAAALLGSPGGPAGARLVVAKRRSAMATVAVARAEPRGRLALVGIGPGSRELLPPAAIAELRRAAIVIGLTAYLDQIADLLRPGTRRHASGLGDEERRASEAVELARAGHAVALIGSGDAGVYAMASPALELAGDDIDVVTVPGITANLAAAALLGAPLGHDHAVVSLSDLHTPWPAILRRVEAAATGDYVISFYNPRSRARDWQLPAALDVLARHRAPDTPVGLVRDATRIGERVELTTLAALDVTRVDMLTTVIVGSTNTRVVAGRMVTPRGYRWLRS